MCALRVQPLSAPSASSTFAPIDPTLNLQWRQKENYIRRRLRASERSSPSFASRPRTGKGSEVVAFDFICNMCAPLRLIMNHIYAFMSIQRPQEQTVKERKAGSVRPRNQCRTRLSAWNV